mmetsp:Transcript_52029/g.156143  ORF Transcript_52029/g.156143 Transcript_52029/m.156143 type:complete len:249 (-) Transcript_52029:277-1023(-)
MTSTLPPPARARLTRELSLLQTDPPPGCAAFAPDESDISSLRVHITGPPKTPYESAVFLLSVRITARYPFEPPRVRFLTPVYHPNIDSAGRICLDTLKSPPAGSWSPAVSLPSLLLSLRALLASPNPDDGLVPEIAELYKRDPDKWRAEAKKRAEKDATEEKLAELEKRLDGGDSERGGETSNSGGATTTSPVASSNREEGTSDVRKSSEEGETSGKNPTSRHREDGKESGSESAKRQKVDGSTSSGQ